MIVFVPAYDEPTRANAAVAQYITPSHADMLLAEGASATALHERLASAPVTPLLALAHGRPDALLGQHGSVALGESHVTLVAARQVFAFACHTAEILAPAGARAGAYWWGYEGYIASPDDKIELLPVFAGVFAFIRDEFPRARERAACERVLHRLADLCAEACERVDAILGPEADLHAYLCLMHVWQRLTVHSPGGPPVRHPHAPPSLMP